MNLTFHIKDSRYFRNTFVNSLPQYWKQGYEINLIFLSIMIISIMAL